MVAQLERAISICLGLQSRSLLIPFCEELFPLLLLLRHNSLRSSCPAEPLLHGQFCSKLSLDPSKKNRAFKRGCSEFDSMPQLVRVPVVASASASTQYSVKDRTRFLQ